MDSSVSTNAVGRTFFVYLQNVQWHWLPYGIFVFNSRRQWASVEIFPNKAPGHYFPAQLSEAIDAGRAKIRSEVFREILSDSVESGSDLSEHADKAIESALLFCAHA